MHIRSVGAGIGASLLIIDCLSPGDGIGAHAALFSNTSSKTSLDSSHNTSRTTILSAYTAVSSSGVETESEVSSVKIGDVIEQGLIGPWGSSIASGSCSTSSGSPRATCCSGNAALEHAISGSSSSSVNASVNSVSTGTRHAASSSSLLVSSLTANLSVTATSNTSSITSATLSSSDDTCDTRKPWPMSTFPYWSTITSRWGPQCIPENTCTTVASDLATVWSPCSVGAGTVQISYWPTNNNYSYPSTYVDPNLGFTFTSPSVYVIAETLWASNECGQVGPTATNMVFPFDLTDVSTIVPATTVQTAGRLETRQLYLSDLAYDCPASATTTYTGYYFQKNEVNRCNPRLVMPKAAKIWGFPYWKSCGVVDFKFGMYDPPGAMPTADGVLAGVTAIPTMTNNAVVSTTTTSPTNKATPSSWISSTSTTRAATTSATVKSATKSAAGSEANPTRPAATAESHAQNDAERSSSFDSTTSAGGSKDGGSPSLPQYSIKATTSVEVENSQSYTSAPSSDSSSGPSSLASVTDTALATQRSGIAVTEAGASGVDSGSSYHAIQPSQVSTSRYSTIVPNDGSGSASDSLEGQVTATAAGFKAFTATISPVGLITVWSSVNVQNPSFIYAIGSQTLSASGSDVTVDGTTYSLAESRSAIVANGQTSAISSDPDQIQPAVTVVAADASATVVVTPVLSETGVYVIAAETVKAGKQAATVSGTTYSVSIGTEDAHILVVAAPTDAANDEGAATVTETVSAFRAHTVGKALGDSDSTKYSVDGQTLSAGGSAVIHDDTTYSLAISDSVVDAHGMTTQTSVLGATPAAAEVTTIAVQFALIVGSHTVGSVHVAADTTEYVIGAQTLSPGGSAITEAGTVYSMPTSASAVVVNGVATKISLVSTNPLVVIGDQTLSPNGAAITYGGTTFSLAESGSALVANGVTSDFVVSPTTSETSGYLIGSQMLSFDGPAVNYRGTKYSLINSGPTTTAVINGITTDLSALPTSSKLSRYVIGTQIFSAGGSAVTYLGTTFSLANSGTATFAVVDGVTTDITIVANYAANSTSSGHRSSSASVSKLTTVTPSSKTNIRDLGSTTTTTASVSTPTKQSAAMRTTVYNALMLLCFTFSLMVF